jgi:hypothetical protein
MGIQSSNSQEYVGIELCPQKGWIYVILYCCTSKGWPCHIATVKAIRGQQSDSFPEISVLHKHYQEQVPMMQKKDPNKGALHLIWLVSCTAIHTYIPRWICNQPSAHNIQKKAERYFQASLIVLATINRLGPIPAGVQQPVVVKLNLATSKCLLAEQSRIISSYGPNLMHKLTWNLCSKN